MLVCPVCNNNWIDNGNQWVRDNGKCDYRCSNCGSKRKPVEIVLGSSNFVTVDNPEKVICNALPELKKKVKKIKKVLFIGDTHCGHKSGLTPPEWFVNPHNKKRYAIQKESWEWFSETINKIGPVDACVCNGDMIDGKGKRSGGSELITSDLFKQVKIAKRCLESIDTDTFYFTYGTDYHVGNDGDDFELSLAEEFYAPIKDHLWLDVNGCVFDIKHKISGSSVLQSRVGALIKEYLWNREWNNINGAPKADVFIRSHVHYHMSVKDPNSFLGMTLPALQVADTKFGGRQCSGTVHYGMVLFEVPWDYTDVDDLKFTVYKKHLKSTESKSIIV